MLIFVQVCRTIVKNLHSNISFERTNESGNIFLKVSLCCKIEDNKSLKTRQ